MPKKIQIECQVYQDLDHLKDMTKYRGELVEIRTKRNWKGQWKSTITVEINEYSKIEG